MTGKDSYASFNGSSIISAGNYMTNYPGQSQDFGTKLSMNHTFPGPKIEPQVSESMKSKTINIKLH